MKNTLLSVVLLLLLFCAKINAQTAIQTWYVIPPTSGCNGVWALDASAFAACGAGPFLATQNPNGCIAPGQTQIADTVYWSLCAFPCDVTITDSNGSICTCTTGTMANTVETSAQFIVTTYPNPATSTSGWNLWLHQPGADVTVNIYNSLGQVVFTQNNSGAEQIVHVDLSSLVAGTYTAQVSVNDAVSYNQQLIVTQ